MNGDNDPNSGPARLGPNRLMVDMYWSGLRCLAAAASLQPWQSRERGCKSVGWSRRRSELGWRYRWPEILVPVPECVFQCAIEDVDADFEKTLNGMAVPSHLLLLRHAFSNDLVDGRLGKAGRDPQTPTVALAVVRHGISVELQVANRIEKHAPQSSPARECVRNSELVPTVRDAPGRRDLHRLAMPKAPFPAF